MDQAAAIATEFWKRMNTNDWRFAASLFADNFEIVWPQSSEKIGSVENFVAINANYPAKDAWVFEVVRIVGENAVAMTETRISDGHTEALALSIFECRDGRILRLTEYWPDTYPAPEWRAQWVQPIARQGAAGALCVNDPT